MTQKTITYFLTLFATMTTLSIFGQTDTIDENYSPFKNPTLTGTTILKESEKIIGARNDGYFLTDIESSDCDQTAFQKGFKNDIRTLTLDGDTMTIDLKIQANCCYSFLAEIEIIEDTLNLIYHGYGGYCFCTCCFGLTYKIETPFPEKKNINYVMINSDKTTLKTMETIKKGK